MNEKFERRWNAPVIVAAPGPSLTAEIAEQCKELPCIAVNDAVRLFPFAEILYAADWQFWEQRKGCPDFKGEKWSCLREGIIDHHKQSAAEKYGLYLVGGKQGEKFSDDPSVINYGRNSGFQAVNLAILGGGNPVILVGFDMYGTHFFGSHKLPLRDTTNFDRFITAFTEAANHIPVGTIINSTPKSALTCFPYMRLEDAIWQARQKDRHSAGDSHTGCLRAGSQGMGDDSTEACRDCVSNSRG